MGEIRDENDIMKEKIRKLKTIYKGLTLKEITVVNKHPQHKVVSSTMAGAGAGPRKSSTHKRPMSSGLGANKVKPYVIFKFKFKYRYLALLSLSMWLS